MKTMRELQMAIVEAAIAWSQSEETGMHARKGSLALEEACDALLAEERREVDEYAGSSDEEEEECATGEDDPIWVARTMVDVRAGDTIRMPGRPETERVVETASVPLLWHVHPKANSYRPNESPAEWTEVKISFTTGDPVPFSFAPTMPVEIEMTRALVTAVEAFGGWENRAR